MDRVRKQIQYEYIANLGLSGKNVNVCVIDTGIYRHNDFENRILYFKDFTNQYRNKIYDDSGHGTHVCGILAGDGTSYRSKYMGIAPNANLIVLKVLDQKGNGNLDQLMEALEWVYQNHALYHIRIVNLSISISYQSIKHKEIEKLYLILGIIEKLYMENVTIITAAGNGGPINNSLSVIGEDKHTLCVGCHDGDFMIHSINRCENYSGRGNISKNYYKPDVVAPGTHIVSCSTTRFGYTKKSGTSMSCPIISGIAANLAELNPSISNQEIIHEIQAGTIILNTPRNQQGFGMVNCKKIFEKYYI